MHHLRCSAVQIPLSFLSTAPPPIGAPEVLLKRGPQPPPSVGIVAVDETRLSAVLRWSKVCSVKTMVAIFSLLTYAVRDLATFTNSLRPPEPPEPPDPPDRLISSPPSLSIPGSRSFSSATPVLAIGSPPWSLSLADCGLAGKAQLLHSLPILRHRRIKPRSSLDLPDTKLENSESPRCRIWSPHGSVSLRIRTRDSVSHLLARRLRRPAFPPPSRSHFSDPPNQYLVAQDL